MRSVYTVAWALALIALLVSPAPSHAQQGAKPFEPEVGQPGKDVVWVPTPPALVEKMMDMAQVGPNDFVIDLGSGDGRNVIAAAKRGARALGVEFNPDMVGLSERLAKSAGVADRAQFVQGDMFTADISKATVMAIFLLPSNMLQLRVQVLRPRPRLADRVEHVPLRRVESRQERDDWRRLHRMVRGDPVDRPGQGGRPVARIGRRADADAGLPDGLGHADGRRQAGAGHRAAERARHHAQGRRSRLHRPRRRHRDRADGARLGAPYAWRARAGPP